MARRRFIVAAEHYSRREFEPRPGMHQKPSDGHMRDIHDMWLTGYPESLTDWLVR